MNLLKWLRSLMVAIKPSGAKPPKVRHWTHLRSGQVRFYDELRDERDPEFNDDEYSETLRTNAHTGRRVLIIRNW